MDTTGNKALALDNLPLEGYALGKFLKEMREKKSVPQRSLYQSGKYKQSHVSNVENGKAEPDIEMLEEYASAIGVEFYSLLLEVVNAYEKYLMGKIKNNNELKSILSKKNKNKK
ncbi:helix-turn-helix domain-containing protein [Flavivirga spongiicola]|uniref:Helix-turn-helix domain-containing protein n=1 Tax=Flavivirga spongiicola TaxID=421621 RepID=A0ABU7XXN4_9FLAO|nr:helix-turn-helix transcriptional regulator [Flavivirga sp. MEBiC05379]MDO5980561.1 helix-turn-helix transcriptional regulator [Flavivirga sp. MEBiC05379]